MGEVIGYQHGIVAGMNGLRDLDPSKTLLKKKDGKWPSIDTLADTPIDQWKAWDKMERAFTILVHDHDAAQTGGGANPPDPGPEPPDPQPGAYAPQAYNQGSRGQNAKFNIRENCTGPVNGIYTDGHGVQYDDSGLCKGGRSEHYIDGLKPSDMMDGKEPWEPYEWMGRTFPPYPAESYEQ